MRCCSSTACPWAAPARCRKTSCATSMAACSKAADPPAMASHNKQRLGAPGDLMTLFKPSTLRRRAWLATAAHAGAAETVRIGFIDLLSGPFALTGQSSLKQLREVVQQVNAKAGPNEPKFEVVDFDNKGSPQESLNVLKAATDRGIRYITQGGGSGVALALVDALNKLAEREPERATVYLNYAAMDPLLTNDKCSFWHFRFYPSSEMKIEALTTYLQGRKDIKKVYLLNQDYTHGRQVSKAAREYLAR